MGMDGEPEPPGLRVRCTPRNDGGRAASRLSLLGLLRLRHPGAGFFAVGLGGDFLELAALHGREGLTGGAFFGVGEGAAVGFEPLAD